MMDNHILGAIGKVVAIGFWVSFALLILVLMPIMNWLDKRNTKLKPPEDE
jgi:hypothetical protein